MSSMESHLMQGIGRAVVPMGETFQSIFPVGVERRLDLYGCFPQ
ncbi:hypothetical protein AciX8_0425 [Granulicella mallensis MP5ACTX8]|uniref:Uncharacterized protein n=1 Tax=Granulicella mallensis (strain ATCC BAA-1857 / DSM 23137 / MP5ACTX8) TaxID=682795 RepID=G8NNJ4_GRAMM|nr:hypothetical protein AciX8_0425 [Granulicella mallensis MP5ACTX8]